MASLGGITIKVKIVGAGNKVSMKVLIILAKLLGVKLVSVEVDQ